MSGSCHWAAPGVRCVCIDDHWAEIRVGGNIVPVRVPMLGEVLTIRALHTGRPFRIGMTLYGDPNEIYLSFWEIPTEQSDGSLSIHAVSWLARQFRPLVEEKTDISVFTEILDRAPVEQRVGEPAHE